MSQTIATASTVFAACDRLDAANERWNREDVRTEVGGGGYVVIDPLIKAWRELKPLREAAPTTPAELLHQVATSLDAHFNGFIETTESRLTATQEVFDATVSELSERLATLESELEVSGMNLEKVSRERTDLVEQLSDNRESLDEAQKTNAQLVIENDGLRGQVARMEKEHKASIEKLASDTKEQAKDNARERKRINDEHSAALAKQRQEHTEVAKQTENRLMILLDQERQAGKASAQQLTHQLAELRQNAQTHREKAIDLEASMRQLTERNKTLTQELAKTEKISSDLSKKLSKEQDRADDIQRKFDAYKREHKISGNLSELQKTVQALQAKLE